MFRGHLILISLAALVLAVAAGSASANRLEFSSQSFRIAWNPLIFQAAGGVSTSCPLTLAGSFHSRTISKVSGQLVGLINVAQFGAGEPPCRGGTMRTRTETLPWHVQYNSFTGTLPRITGVTITFPNIRFEIVAAGVRCEAGTSQSSPLFGRANLTTEGRIAEFRALEEHTIPLGGAFLCNLVTPGRFAGTATLDNGSGAAITVRLVR